MLYLTRLAASRPATVRCMRSARAPQNVRWVRESRRRRRRWRCQRRCGRRCGGLFAAARRGRRRWPTAARAGRVPKRGGRGTGQAGAGAGARRQGQGQEGGGKGGERRQERKRTMRDYEDERRRGVLGVPRGGRRCRVDRAAPKRLHMPPSCRTSTRATRATGPPVGPGEAKVERALRFMRVAIL